MSNVPSQAKQIDATIWEIPTSYKRGMLVPGRIIATKKLFDQIDTQVFDQIANVAMLPGIQKYSLAMPDCHRGYGVAIGGVAAFDTETGIISPGGIGFDINCLHPDTRVAMEFGTWKKIKDMHSCADSVSYMDLENYEKLHSKPVIFLAKESESPILKIRTLTGQEIILSSDHPLYTGTEFVEAGQVEVGQKLVVKPFVGVEYEVPSNEIILDEEDIIKLVGNRENVIRELKEKSLLPLRYNSKRLPILAKLIGFITGDGWVGSYFSKKRNMDIWSTRIIGEPEDLEEIKKDIHELGFKASYIATKAYSSVVSTASGRKQK